jgi:hypothetical protein
MGEAGGGGGVVKHSDLILRSGLKGRVSKDGSIGASWFETREHALLTMRDLGQCMAASSIFALARGKKPR